MNQLNTLIGKTIKSVWLNNGNDQIRFITDDGDFWFCCGVANIGLVQGVQFILGNQITEITENLVFEEELTCVGDYYKTFLQIRAFNIKSDNGVFTIAVDRRSDVNDEIEFLLIEQKFMYPYGASCFTTEVTPISEIKLRELKKVKFSDEHIAEDNITFITQDKYLDTESLSTTPYYIEMRQSCGLRKFVTHEKFKFKDARDNRLFHLMADWKEAKQYNSLIRNGKEQGL